MRLNANGSFDTSFSNARGSGTTGPYNSSDFVQTIGLEPDGHIVVGGTFSTFSGIASPGLIRLAVDGTPDPAGFQCPGFVGVVVPSVSGTLIAGNFRRLLGQRRWSIARLLKDQSLDSTFHPLVTSRRAGDVRLIARQPDDKLIVSGIIEDG